MKNLFNPSANLVSAIEKLELAENIQQWNEIREEIKNTLTVPELAYIDSNINNLFPELNNLKKIKS